MGGYLPRGCPCGRRGFLLQLRAAGVAGAGDEVVVDHTGGLHERVDDGGADEFEAAGEEVFREGVALGCARGDVLHGAAAVDDRATIQDEAPKVAVEGAELFLHGEEGFRVADGRSDFQAVADDTGVGEERSDFFGVVAGDFGGVEVVEGAAVVFAFGEDGGPAEAGLGTFERDEFEEGAVVVVRDAPLGVVVGDVERFGRPGAAGCRHESEETGKRARRMREISGARVRNLSAASVVSIRAHAAAGENIGNFFGEDIFIAVGAILLMKGFFDAQGMNVSVGAMALWGIPTAFIAFGAMWWRCRLLDRRIEQAAADEQKAGGGQ